MFQRRAIPSFGPSWSTLDPPSFQIWPGTSVRTLFLSSLFDIYHAILGEINCVYTNIYTCIRVVCCQQLDHVKRVRNLKKYYNTSSYIIYCSVFGFSLKPVLCQRKDRTNQRPTSANFVLSTAYISDVQLT